MAPPRPLQAELIGAQPVWLLTITWRGKVYRWSTQRVEITTDAGETLLYPGGLAQSVMEEALSEGSISSATIPLRVIFEEDLIAASVRGHRLSTASGCLDMVSTRDMRTAVQTWEGRYRYIQGRVVSPEIAAVGQPRGLATFSLETTAGQDQGRILPPAAAISSTVWLSCRTGVEGKVIPKVFGAPGSYLRSGVAGGTSGSPAYAVDDTSGSANTLAVAWGHVSASTATIFADDNSGFTGTLVKDFDNLGNAVTTVDISGKSAAIRQSEGFWVGWTDGPAAVLPYADTDHMGAGDILRYLWTASTLPVDHGAWAAAAEALNGIQLAFYVNDLDVSPSEWVLGNTSNLLPVELILGADGITPVVDEVEVSAVGCRHVVEGPDFLWVGPLTEDRTTADIISSYSLRFAARARTGDYKRTITIASEAADGAVYEALSMVDADLMGATGAAEVRETKIIYDDVAAGRVARYRARRMATISQGGTFSAAQHHGWLSPGDRFAVTSETLGVTNLVTQVRTKRWTGSRWVYGVRWDYGLSGPRR